jgi:hypothetical protein
VGRPARRRHYRARCRPRCSCCSPCS